MDFEVQNAMKYLVRFGYIEDQDAKVKEIPADVLTKFQEFHGIATTGVLDDATLEVMKLPRCRVKDFQPDVSHRSCHHLTMPNSKPLAYNWGKWDKTTLTWRVTQYSRRSGMPKELVHEGLRRAFNKWERHSPIRFEWVETGVPDIEIRWEMEEHGDGDEFDGEGGTLAHALATAIALVAPPARGRRKRHRSGLLHQISCGSRSKAVAFWLTTAIALVAAPGRGRIR